MTDSVVIESDDITLLLDLSPAELVLATDAPYRIIPETDTVEVVIEDLSLGITIDAATGANGRDGTTSSIFEAALNSNLTTNTITDATVHSTSRITATLMTSGIMMASGVQNVVNGSFDFVTADFPEIGDKVFYSVFTP